MGKGNRIKIYALFAFSLVLVIVSLFFSFGTEKPLQSVEYDVFFIAENGSVGVDVNSSLLTFGKISPGGGGVKRFVVIDNGYGFPIEAKVFLTTDVARFIETNHSTIIDSGKNATLSFRLSLPESTESGEYNGKVRIDLYKYEM